MTWQPASEPDLVPEPCDGVEIEIVPRVRDLGGFEVRRVLPATRRQMVGPFIFLDEMGPADFDAGGGLDVPPHPHIGLATVTYLLEGELVHRDSLGTVQTIRPGDVNWMSAGRGIAHSERTPARQRGGGARLAGLQASVALPAEAEEGEPFFAHHGVETLPLFEDNGLRVRVVAGSLWGASSPVVTASPLFYADAALATGVTLTLPTDHEERAVYVVSGAVALGGEVFEAGRLLVLRPGDPVRLAAFRGARCVLLGGAPVAERRYIWWNFVARSRERIEQAAADWETGRFPDVPGETERLPLPAWRR